MTETPDGKTPEPEKPEDSALDKKPSEEPKSDAPAPEAKAADKPADKAAAAKPDKPAADADKVPAKKPAAKKPAAKKKPKAPKEDPKITRRRGFVLATFTASMGAMLFWSLRFFFPRALFEPPTKFPIGSPDDFAFGVDTKFQQERRIWVVRQPGKMFVIFARCTHLGCTPDWKPAENKFKCPCHGSGFDIEGVNFEGPAPVPLFRTALSLDARGALVVDKGRLFAQNQWDEADAFVAV